MKKYTFLVFVLSLMFLSGVVYAEDNTPLTGKSTNSSSFREQQKRAIDEIKQNREQERTEMKTVIQKTREDFKNQIEIKRQELKVKLSQNRETLKTRLEGIKDQRKQKTVLNVNDNITKINEIMTDRLNGLVDRIETALNNIEGRTNTAKDEGVDTSSVDTLIVEARAKISNARNSILNQAGKTYPIEAVDEATLKEVVKTVRDQFHSDLKAVQEIVKEAHASVIATVQTLGPLLEDNNAINTPDTTDTTTE